MYELRVYGARGTMPSLAHAAGKYGGHTTCYSVETEEGPVVFRA